LPNINFSRPPLKYHLFNHHPGILVLLIDSQSITNKNSSGIIGQKNDQLGWHGGFCPLAMIFGVAHIIIHPSHVNVLAKNYAVMKSRLCFFRRQKQQEHCTQYKSTCPNAFIRMCFKPLVDQIQLVKQQNIQCDEHPGHQKTMHLPS
jgi:hypothetical protein